MESEEIVDIITNLFECNEFLNSIYGITSYEKGIEYLDNNVNIADYTKMRILNCLFILYINEDYFPSKEYINYIHDTYYNAYDIKLKKNSLKNIFINYKYSSEKLSSYIQLITKNLKYIIEE